MSWEIKYYKAPSGRFPVYEFINKFNTKLQAKVHNTFELLTEFGTRLGLPRVKKETGTPLWELRVLGKKSLRFFYVAVVDKSFLMLHSFNKKSQKTPKKEIKIALERLKDFRKRNKT